MKPPPASTNETIAAFCAAANASSPDVSVNINTSVDDNDAALTSARFSVAVTANVRVRAARSAITCLAAGIESWRKPAVAVSISTRTGAAAGDGVCGVGAAGDGELRGPAHAT